MIIKLINGYDNVINEFNIDINEFNNLTLNDFRMIIETKTNIKYYNQIIIYNNNTLPKFDIDSLDEFNLLNTYINNENIILNILTDYDRFNFILNKMIKLYDMNISIRLPMSITNDNYLLEYLKLYSNEKLIQVP